MRSPVVDVTVTLPLSLSGETEDEVLRFARWIERPIQGHDDPRVPALIACAEGLVRAYRERRDREVRHA